MPIAPRKVTKLSAIKVNEISLCDSPANPGSNVILTKSKNSPGASCNTMWDAAIEIQKSNPGMNMTEALTRLALDNASVKKSADHAIHKRAGEIKANNPKLPITKCLAQAYSEEGAKHYAAG